MASPQTCWPPEVWGEGCLGGPPAGLGTQGLLGLVTDSCVSPAPTWSQRSPMSPACGSGPAPGRGPLPSPCSLRAHRPSQDGAPRVLPTSTPATWCRRSRLVDTQAAFSQQCSEDQAEQETGLSEAGRAHRALPTEQAEPRTGAHCPTHGGARDCPQGLRLGLPALQLLYLGFLSENEGLGSGERKGVRKEEEPRPPERLLCVSCG